MPSTTPLLTRTEARHLSGASTTIVNKAVEQRVIATKSVERTSLVDARDAGSLALFASLHFGLPVRDKRRLARWLRGAAVGTELALSPAIIVRKTPELAEVTAAAVRYAELKGRFLEVDPERQGGEPVIRGTRIPIRGLARQIEADESLEVLRQEYDYFDEDAFEFAVLWARANPRRGRPAKLGPSSPGREPEGRHAHIEARRRTGAAAASA